jgi:hypothetical protein
MPKPLKVKIFMDARPGVLEEQIDAWLEHVGSPAIIKTETSVIAAERPTIVITIWYEPPP